jgi:hypothetical protein
MRRIALPIAFAALASLAGCVGAPGPRPYGYAPGGPPPGYVQPGYPPPGYPPPYYRPQGGYAERPPMGQQVAFGATCYAGVYTCPLPQARPMGAPCSCPGLGAPSYGNVH